MHDRLAVTTPSKARAVGAARVGIGGPVGSGKTALIERLIPISPDAASIWPSSPTTLSPKKMRSGCAAPV
jgi:GTPase SAR1 family protein